MNFILSLYLYFFQSEIHEVINKISLFILNTLLNIFVFVVSSFIKNIFVALI